MKLFVGYSKAPEQPQSSARPICHSHTMTNTGHEPATIRIAAYWSSLRYALRHGRLYMGKHKGDVETVWTGAWIYCNFAPAWDGGRGAYGVGWWMIMKNCHLPKFTPPPISKLPVEIAEITGESKLLCLEAQSYCCVAPAWMRCIVFYEWLWKNVTPKIHTTVPIQDSCKFTKLQGSLKLVTLVCPRIIGFITILYLLG